jgi:hypothetical protein
MKAFMRKARPFVKLFLICYCVSVFFFGTKPVVQLGDNYKYYKISSILRVILREKIATYTWKTELKINSRQSQKPIEAF